jgi:hypothetical protein
LLAVGHWKSTRVLSRLNSNSDEDIEDITRVALSAPNRLKHRILHLLAGVQTPVASALLTVWNADMFTVTDVRAMETLRAHGEFSGPDPRYTPYLALCRDIAMRARCDLQTLDRALWTWSKQLGSADKSAKADPVA